MPIKTGLVEITVIFVHMCRLWVKYSVKAEAQLAAAVTAGKITSAQKANFDAFATTMNDLCTILRDVTGY